MDKGEQQRALVAAAWEGLQAALAAWAAYELLARLLRARNRK